MLRPRPRWRRRGRFVLVAAVIILAAWIRFGPLPSGLLDEPVPSTVVLDRHGEPLYEARAADGTRGVRLSPDALPPAVVAATIAAEDHRFWSHPGVDPIAILRALRANLVERSIVEGGSTISQQVSKLLLNRRDPDRRRGWRAKVHEAVLAMRLEHRFDKRELLAMYLNLAAYGNQIVGIERASQAYFGRTAAMLTPAQAAFLAGLPQRPSGFNPYRNRDAALSRGRVVISRMEASGALSAAEAREAREEQLTFRPAASAFVAPHFVQMVLAGLGDDRPAEVRTTLDARLQRDVLGVIESHRAALRRHGAANVAVVVLNHRTGELLAWEGSGNYSDADAGGTINGPLSPRQPGSALKPFTYALAFENGYTPASVLADVPSSFPTAEEGIVYSPRNYDGSYRGPLLARAALAGSTNIPAVALTAELGVARLQRFLARAGITTFDKTSSHYGLGLTLGNAEVRLDELTAAYAALARGGEWIEPTWRLGGPARPTRRLVSPRTAFWISDILSDGEAREFAFGRGGSLELPFPVAVKTGTSQAYHDNWTIGYSAHVTVGVWVGNFDRTPLRNSSGVTGAAPIFHGVMLAAERHVAGREALHATAPVLTPPVDTVQHDICSLSGGAATDWCPNRRREWAAAESQGMPCSWHHMSDEGLLAILPPEYAAWNGAGAVGHIATAPRASGAFPPHPGPSPRASAPPAPVRSKSGTFAISSPADGSTYLIDPTLRREFQTLSLKTIAGSGAIEWKIDGRSLGRSNDPVEWPLSPGVHRITACDSRGRTAEVSITVR